MSLSRQSFFGLLLVLAVAAFGLAWTHLDLNREGDMRASEDAFYEGIKSGPKRATNPFAADYRPETAPSSKPAAKPDASAASLDAWYAESGTPAEGTEPADAAEGTAVAGSDPQAPLG